MSTIQISTTRPCVGQAFQLAIGAVGYERRARFALRKLKPHSERRIALEFQDRQVHDFKENKRSFEEAGFSTVSATTETVHSIIAEWIRHQTPTEGQLNVWVDISSLTRPLIATLCYELWSNSQIERSVIRTSFVYSQARFSPPPRDYGPIVHKGAVIPEFAGWSDDPATPCSTIFGIGYEVGLALGALEFLEPAEAWAFRPTGHVRAYDRAIDKNNADFLAELSPDHILTYDVGAPLQLVSALESLVYGSLQTRRIIIIPFGLKTFALAACLVALQHFPRVTVWRVSGGTLVEAINRLPNGRISQIDVLFDGAHTEMPFQDYQATTSAVFAS